MAIRKSLQTLLVDKAVSLRLSESTNAEAANAFIVASETATNKSAEARLHAGAVERALVILKDAGVQL